MHAAHAIAVPSTSGATTGVFAPRANRSDPTCPTVAVVGLTIENTSTTSALTVIVRDGGATGPILATGSAPTQAGVLPGVFDAPIPAPRRALNGLYFEIDGGTVGAGSSVWVR